MCNKSNQQPIEKGRGARDASNTNFERGARNSNGGSGNQSSTSNRSGTSR